MSDDAVLKIADEAQLIVAGFTFTKGEDSKVRILNLENTDEACVLDFEGNMIETTMDDAKLCMVQAYYLKNREFMEA